MKSRTLALAAAALLLAWFQPVSVAAQEEGARSVSGASAQFAVDLYRQMNDGSEANLFFSPYSIYTVLALLYGGARGETAEQIAAALHDELGPVAFHAAMADIQARLEAVGEAGDVELDIANALWPQTGAEVAQEFLRLAKTYGTEVNPVDYRREGEAVREEINRWGEDHTNGRIREIINWDLHPETHLLISNAIFFKGNWASRFDEAETETAPFYRSDGSSVDVEMMHQLGEFALIWESDAQILVLPYEGEDLSMVIVLPNEIDGLEAIEQTVTGDDLVAWADPGYTEPVHVYLPRFRVESAFDLVKHGDLAALGMTDAVDVNRADFSGVANPRNWLYIVVFVHKAFVDVNEEGTEAAAVTVGGCFPAGTVVQTPDGGKPIETVADGDRVYAYDLSAGRWVTTAAVAVHSYDFAGEMITVEVGGESIQATWNHPFLVVRGDALDGRRRPMDLPDGEPVSTSHGRWVEARDLRAGDVLLTRSGGTSVVSAVASRSAREQVYALEIAGPHNHTVGPSGVLVHNGLGAEGEKASAGPEGFIADHPFLFYICDSATRSILFMGRVGEPVAGEPVAADQAEE